MPHKTKTVQSAGSNDVDPEISFRQQFGSDQQPVIRIHGEDINGCATGRCPANYPRSIESKVLRPAIITGMKQSDEPPGLGVEPRNIRTLITIAVSTGQRKVGLCRLSTVLFRNYVIDLKR